MAHVSSLDVEIIICCDKRLLFKRGAVFHPVFLDCLFGRNCSLDPFPCLIPVKKSFPTLVL